MKTAPDWPLGWVRTRLGYEPVDLELFRRALTHRSAGSRNNERLEFLGDAVLSLVVADYLYARHVDADEGALSRLRARIVSGESLAQLASALGIGEQLMMGPGEMKTGGHRRESILADAFESVCGALLLDAGFVRAAPLLLKLLEGALARADEPDMQKDAKTRLQEWLQSRGLALPIYSVEAISGEAHQQSFQVRCQISAPGVAASGVGPSRRRAEQQAAALVLEQLEAGVG